MLPSVEVFLLLLVESVLRQVHYSCPFNFCFILPKKVASMEILNSFPVFWLSLLVYNKTKFEMKIETKRTGLMNLSLLLAIPADIR